MAADTGTGERAGGAAWEAFGGSALAALGALVTMPASRARSALLMPALRLARALGLRTATVQRALRASGIAVGQDEPSTDATEELRREAQAGIARLRDASTPGARREALAALRQLSARVAAEQRRVTAVAEREPAQRPLADRMLAAMRRTRELLSEAAGAVREVTDAVTPGGGGFGAGLGTGVLLIGGLIIAALIWAPKG